MRRNGPPQASPRFVWTASTEARITEATRRTRPRLTRPVAPMGIHRRALRRRRRPVGADLRGPPFIRGNTISVSVNRMPRIGAPWAQTGPAVPYETEQVRCMTECDHGEADAPGLVSAEMLSQELASPDAPVVLDARFVLDQGPKYEEYVGGHIPTSLFVDFDRELSGPRNPRIGHYPLPDVSSLQESVREWGLGPDTNVVAYAGYTGISAGRLGWLLQWAGHRRVRLLDGGLQAWVRLGYPLNEGPEIPAGGGTFSVRPSSSPTVTAQEAILFGELGQLLDVRARSQFNLTTPDPAKHGRRPGRIPGAANVPSTALHRRNGLARRRNEIHTILEDVGVDPRRPVAVYCGGGVASAWATYVLRSVGIDARFFSASWSEYVLDPDHPIEVAPGSTHSRST